MQQGDGLLFLLYDTLNTLLDRNIESDGFDDWPVTVYLFIGEHIALVDFVQSLQHLGVLGKGEYVIISIDDFIYDPETNAQQYTRRSRDNQAFIKSSLYKHYIS